jgi:YD repeat-containing protein
MHNIYTFGAVDNILSIVNDTQSRHAYSYDDLNRLVSAAGKARDASYTLGMEYDIMGNPTGKRQMTQGSQAGSHEWAYVYNGPKICFSIVLFAVSSQIIGQNDNQLNSMIVSSIDSYIRSDKELVKQGFSLRDTSYYYVCIDGLPSDFHSDSLQNVVFFSLNNLEGLPNAFKSKLNKGIKTLFVKISLSNQRLEISISGRGVKRLGKNNLSILIGDWSIFIYEYSCNSQIWELKETKFGGIQKDSPH